MVLSTLTTYIEQDKYMIVQRHDPHLVSLQSNVSHVTHSKRAQDVLCWRDAGSNRQTLEDEKVT